MDIGLGGKSPWNVDDRLFPLQRSKKGAVDKTAESPKAIIRCVHFRVITNGCSLVSILTK